MNKLILIVLGIVIVFIFISAFYLSFYYRIECNPLVIKEHFVDLSRSISSSEINKLIPEIQRKLGC